MSDTSQESIETVQWRLPVSMLALLEQVGALLFVEDPDKGQWVPDVRKAAAIVDVLAEGDQEIAQALHQQLQDSYLEYLRMPAAEGQDVLRPVP